MVVLADTQAFLDQLKAMAGPKIRDLPADIARQVFSASTMMFEAEAPALAKIENLMVPGPAGNVPVRLYDPAPGADGGPVLVFFHGGGWVIGDLNTHNSLCAEIAKQLGIRVVSVDYRLAPEHQFPAAYEDSLAVVEWVATSPTVLARSVTGLLVAGDSAGGNLAAVIAQSLKGRANINLMAQFLIYPATDMVGEYESYARYGEGFLLERADMDYFTNAYAPTAEQRADLRASPLRAPDLRGLPPAVIVTCGLDPLLEQGRAYADKLKSAGVPVWYHEAAGQIHGCFNLRKMIPSAQACLTEALAHVKPLLV